MLDRTGEIASAYRIQGVPTAHFIDPEGRTANVKIGETTVDDLTALVESAR